MIALAELPRRPHAQALADAAVETGLVDRSAGAARPRAIRRGDASLETRVADQSRVSAAATWNRDMDGS